MSKRKRTPRKAQKKARPKRRRAAAARDDFGREFLKLKGSVDPSVDLEFP